MFGIPGITPGSPNFGRGMEGGGGGEDDAHVLLQCPLLPGNSRVDVRINYWFNGSMTKNVKEGLGAGSAGLRPVCSPHLRCEWKISLYLTKRIYKEHLHPSQLFTSSADKSATR